MNYSKLSIDDENIIDAIKGTLDEDDIDPITKVFFSKNNMNRIQRHIKDEVSKRTHGQYNLTENQDDNDLLIVMKAIYLQHNKFSNGKTIRQVKRLNQKVIEYIIPDIINNIESYYRYIKEINEPLKPLMRPMNVNNKGRKCLPSITSVWNA